MVNLNYFLDEMVKRLGLSRTDILDDINTFNEVNKLIDKITDENKEIKTDMQKIFNDLLTSDNDINNAFNNISKNENIIVNDDNLKAFKIVTGKIQLKLLLKKYSLYLTDNKLINAELIDAINNKLKVIIKLMEADIVKNKYYVYYKYIKYKNKYLKLKYNNI